MQRREKKAERKVGKKRGQDELDDDELEDLANDARLVKKLKKGKVGSVRYMYAHIPQTDFSRKPIWFQHSLNLQ